MRNQDAGLGGEAGFSHGRITPACGPPKLQSCFPWPNRSVAARAAWVPSPGALEPGFYPEHRARHSAPGLSFRPDPPRGSRRRRGGRPVTQRSEPQLHRGGAGPQRPPLARRRPPPAPTWSRRGLRTSEVRAVKYCSSSESESSWLQ